MAAHSKASSYIDLRHMTMLHVAPHERSYKCQQPLTPDIERQGSNGMMMPGRCYYERSLPGYHQTQR